MKIGTLGTSQITQQFIESALQVENCMVIACCSRELSKARELANRFNIKDIYNDFDQMCKDGKIDTVYIACPNHYHYSYAKRALIYNLNVIVEKPFTSNYKEACKLIELAKSKKKYLFEAMPILYSKEYKQFKKYVLELQDIKIINANYSQRSRKYDEVLADKIPNSFDIKQSGGALMDLNIYNIHAIVDLFGEPKECFYYVNKIKTGIDTSGIAILIYNDKQAVCTAAKDSTSPNYFEVQGNNGYVNIIGGINFGEKIFSSMHNEEMLYTLKQERLKNEIAYITELVNSNNIEMCYSILEHTKKVMKVCDRLRGTAGVEFDADKEEIYIF